MATQQETTAKGDCVSPSLLRPSSEAEGILPICLMVSSKSQLSSSSSGHQTLASSHSEQQSFTDCSLIIKSVYIVMQGNIVLRLDRQNALLHFT